MTAAASSALEPFDRGPTGENPYQIQYELQESMQDLVGIVRTESEMQQALERICKVANASRSRRDHEPSPIQQRLAHRDGSCRTCSTCLRPSRVPRCFDKESRGAQFREDFPNKDAGVGKIQHRRQARRGRRDAGGEAIRGSHCLDELKAIIEEMK